MTDLLFTKLKSVDDEASLIAFARALQVDREAAEGALLSPDGFKGDWANNSIAEFLEAAVAWAEDSEFGARPGPKAANPWALFAAFLWAGRRYE